MFDMLLVVIEKFNWRDRKRAGADYDLARTDPDDFEEVDRCSREAELNRTVAHELLAIARGMAEVMDEELEYTTEHYCGNDYPYMKIEVKE